MSALVEDPNKSIVVQLENGAASSLMGMIAATFALLTVSIKAKKISQLQGRYQIYRLSLTKVHL